MLKFVVLGVERLLPGTCRKALSPQLYLPCLLGFATNICSLSPLPHQFPTQLLWFESTPQTRAPQTHMLVSFGKYST